MQDNRTNFRNLNREARWLDFSWQGLELRPDGALQLATLPLLQGTLPVGLEELPLPVGPAGVAVDWDRSVYFTDPATDRVLRISGCDGQVAHVPCIGGRNGDSTRLHTPRGLLIPTYRRVLLVVDSGNHRIQIFDLDSWQLLEVWGQPAGGSVQPSAEPGGFDTPWTAASDAMGNVYVLDYGNRRVQKFGVSGDVEPAFWQTMHDSSLLTRPADVAAYSTAKETWLYVLDTESNKVFIFDADGKPRMDEQGNVLVVSLETVTQPMGMAAAANALYVGDNGQGKVVKFEKRKDTFHLVGTALGYHGPIAALTFNGKGDLLVHTGTAMTPVTLALDKGYRANGLMWSKAISVLPDKVAWYRLLAEDVMLPAGAHLQFFVRTADTLKDPPVVPDSDDPFPAPDWRRRESDVTDFFLGGDRAQYLWVGARFSSNGLSSAVLPQMRVEFNRAGYGEFLPAIYRERNACGDFLTRFLALFESFFAEAERDIARLAKFFDPASIPKEYLPWLARWLALEMEEDWSEERQRQTVAEAFTRYARRGTREELRDSMLLYAGVNAVIEEPILNAAWWALPEQGETCCCQKSGEPAWTGTQDSVLGFTTMLAPAHPQGAVLGTSAVLDQSHLIAGDELGLPLFSDVAHQFTVQVYRGQVRSQTKLTEVETILEREKPAHTAYHLCFVEPRLRVGFQARVGIDAVVAGTPSPTALGDPATPQLVLGGQSPGRIGQQSRVGTTTRL